MRAKIDINEVELRTKIRAKYLRAIENEEWDLLPGDVYARSFLRTYGDFLGLDSRALIDDYRRRYEHPSDHDLRPISPRRRERERGPRGPRVPAWALVGIVLLGVVVALYFVGRPNATSSPTATLGTQTRHHTGARHRSLAARPGSPRHRRRPTSVHLQLVPTGSVYVCLVDGTGRKLIPGQTFSAGQTIPIETGRTLLLTLGNAAVQMKVNGRTVAIAPSSTPIGYRLTPRGHSLLTAAQQPTCA